MKKLLLASNGKFLFDKGYQLLGVPLKDLRIGYIITASKGTANTDYLKRHRDEMKKAKLHFEEMDIERKTKKELEKFVSDKNAVHVEGGNTFYLLKAFRQTGFDKIIEKSVKNGLIYIGTSAGAYIACPTIETTAWKSERNRFGVTDFKALGFVPFVMKVHYTDDMKPMIREKMKDLHYPLRILRDGQGILVEGEKYTFVGEGKEVVLH